MMIRQELYDSTWNVTVFKALTTPFDGLNDAFYDDCRGVSANMSTSSFMIKCDVVTGRIVFVWGEDCSLWRILCGFESRASRCPDAVAAVINWMTKGEVDQRFAAKDAEPDPIEVECRLAYIEKYAAAEDSCVDRAKVEREFFGNAPRRRRGWVCRGELAPGRHFVIC